MASEQHHKGSARAEGEQEDVATAESEAVAARKEKLDDEIDSILDEIDDVLEENAAEFVSSFVQKGGE